MYYYNTIDMRFALPPFLNFLLHLLLTSVQNSSVKVVLNETTLLMLLFICLFVFFFVSFRFRFSVSVFTEPIRLRFCGFCFSGLLNFALLASILFSPLLFWSIYLICICISPWSSSLFEVLNRWLKSMPDLIITCIQGSGDGEAQEIANRHVHVEAMVEVNEEYLLGDQEFGEMMIYGHA